MAEAEVYIQTLNMEEGGEELNCENPTAATAEASSEISAVNAGDSQGSNNEKDITNVG